MQAYCNKRLIGGMYAESDLAAERRRADITLDGIEYRREEKVGCSWERIRVYSDAGEKSIGRPRGYYSTLNLSRMDMRNIFSCVMLLHVANVSVKPTTA